MGLTQQFCSYVSSRVPDIFQTSFLLYSPHINQIFKYYNLSPGVRVPTSRDRGFVVFGRMSFSHKDLVQQHYRRGTNPSLRWDNSSKNSIKRWWSTSTVRPTEITHPKSSISGLRLKRSQRRLSGHLPLAM